MHKNTWILIAGIVAGLNLLMMTANTAIASDAFDLKTNDLKQVYKHGVTHETKRGYSFSFSSQQLCAPDGKICVRVWGSGYFTPDRDSITGRGNYERIVEEKGLVRSTWTAVDLISGSDKKITFVARYAKGDIGVILDTGDATNLAKMCVYGKVIGITSPDNAVCAKGATVKIK